VAAYHHLTLVLESNDLGTRPERCYLGRGSGFGEWIETVEGDIKPGCNFPEGLPAFPAGHLHKPRPGGQSLQKKIEFTLIGRNLLEAVHGEDIGLFLGKYPKEPEGRDTVF
jgi:hypothetical protein